MTTICKTLVLTKGGDINRVTFKCYFIGTITFEITADFDSVSPTWDTITPLSGVFLTHTFTLPGDQVALRITGATGAKIYTLADANTNQVLFPGLYLSFNYF